MSKACIVPFFKYEPSARGNNKFLFEYFVKGLRVWGQEIDHLYLINSGHMLTAANKETLNSIVRTTVYDGNSNSHWGNLNKYIPTITEDRFMLIDSDTVIYSADFVKDLFDKLTDYELVSITDGSGGVRTYEKFSAMAANENRDTRRRLAPYLFACQTNLFRRIGSFDCSPTTGDNWTDSFGVATEQLLALNPKFYELPDDRGSIYYIDGQHHTSAFLDAPTFKWSAEAQHDYGYYHTRNWGGGHYLLETRVSDQKAYRHQLSIMPRQEAFRLLGWMWVMGDEVYRTEILAVAADFGIDENTFKTYMTAFYAFHKGAAAL